MNSTVILYRIALFRVRMLLSSHTVCVTLVLCVVFLAAAAVELSASTLHCTTLLFTTGRQNELRVREKENQLNGRRRSGRLSSPVWNISVVFTVRVESYLIAAFKLRRV